MNKLLVDGEILYINEGVEEIHASGNSVLYIENHKEPITLKIYVEENSNIEVRDLNIENNDMHLEVYQTGISKFSYTHSFKTSACYNLYYRAYIEGNRNENNVNITGVSSGNVFLDIDGIIKPNTKQNRINENVRILTIEGKAEILPMLHVAALDVEANHNTAISNIREDILFYLMSKGIGKNKCIELISDAYVYGLFRDDEEYIKRINK